MAPFFFGDNLVDLICLVITVFLAAFVALGLEITFFAAGFYFYCDYSLAAFSVGADFETNPKTDEDFWTFENFSKLAFFGIVILFTILKLINIWIQI